MSTQSRRGHPFGQGGPLARIAVTGISIVFLGALVGGCGVPTGDELNGEGPQLDVVRESLTQNARGVSQIGPWGGSGGGAFKLGTGTQIRKITIRGGSFVDRLEITYEALGLTYVVGWGGSGGTAYSINLAPGEYVTRVSGRWGSYVDRLEFTTSRGQFLAVGGSGGNPFSVDLGERKIQGFFGRGATYLDSIGFYTGTGAPRYSLIKYVGDKSQAMTSQQYTEGLVRLRSALSEVMRNYYVEFDVQDLGKNWDAPTSDLMGELRDDLERDFPASGQTYVVGFTNWSNDHNGIAGGNHAVIAWDVPFPWPNYEEMRLSAHELSHLWGASSSHVDQYSSPSDLCLMAYDDLYVMCLNNDDVVWCPTDWSALQSHMNQWCPRGLTGAGSGGGSGAYCLATYTFPVVYGRSYEISTCGRSTGDTYLKVTGACTCTNDDACGLGSRCTCTASYTGTAYICASTYGSSSATWDYSVSGNCR